MVVGLSVCIFQNTTPINDILFLKLLKFGSLGDILIQTNKSEFVSPSYFELPPQFAVTLLNDDIRPIL